MLFRRGYATWVERSKYVGIILLILQSIENTMFKSAAFIPLNAVDFNYDTLELACCTVNRMVIRVYTRCMQRLNTVCIVVLIV
jgi:hypothetical protein